MYKSNVMFSQETIDKLTIQLEALFDSGELSEVQHLELSDLYSSLLDDDVVTIYLGEQGNG
jgi:hypothetical protein